MDTIKLTKWFSAIIFTAIVVYDVFVSVNAPKGDTISEVQLGWSWVWSTIPLAWGVVVGHLTWPSKVINHKWVKIGVMWGIAALSVIADVIDFYDVMPLIPAVIGFFIGHFLWAQKWEDTRLFYWKR